MSSLTHNYYQKNQRDLERERKERKAIGRERERETQIQIDGFFLFVLDFQREREALWERGSCGEIKTELRVMVRENQLRESGSWPETGGRRRNGDNSGYGCHRREFEDLGNGCSGPPVVHRSLSLLLYSFSLQIWFEIGYLFFFLFFSFLFFKFLRLMVVCEWAHYKVWNKMKKGDVVIFYWRV